MTTDTTDRTDEGRESPAQELARASYRLFHVQVRRTQVLSPNFVRVTFTSPELGSFGAGGFDQRIKVLLPPRPVGTYELPDDDWYGWWRGLPDDVRPVMRTYTVRAARPERCELDVDFVLHGVSDGHAGPASTWASTAVEGSTALLVGPANAGTGRMWGVEWAPPAGARTLLLAGDETAVPAVLAVLEQLPTGVRATALLEVPDGGDVLGVDSDADVTLEWLPRNGSAHGSRLSARVPEVAAALVDEVSADQEELEDVDIEAGILWDVPEDAVASGPGAVYAWLAGEAGVVKELRRHLVREVGVPRRSVAFMGYWRQGRAESD